MPSDRRQFLASTSLLAASSAAGCGFFQSDSSPQEGGLPPGIGEEVVESVYGLLATHHSLLLERGFSVETVHSRLYYAEDGRLQSSGQTTRDVRIESRNEIRGRYLRTGNLETVVRPRGGIFDYLFHVDFDWYGRNEEFSFQFYTGEGVVFEEWTPPDDYPLIGIEPTVYTYRPRLEEVLTDATVLSIDRTVDGTLQRVVLEQQATADDLPDQSRDIRRHIVATVGPEGIIKRARLEVLSTPLQGPAKEREIITHQFTKIGETAVTQPDWASSVPG